MHEMADVQRAKLTINLHRGEDSLWAEVVELPRCVAAGRDESELIQALVRAVDRELWPSMPTATEPPDIRIERVEVVVAEGFRSRPESLIRAIEAVFAERFRSRPESLISVTVTGDPIAVGSDFRTGLSPADLNRMLAAVAARRSGATWRHDPVELEVGAAKPVETAAPTPASERLQNATPELRPAPYVRRRPLWLVAAPVLLIGAAVAALGRLVGWWTLAGSSASAGTEPPPIEPVDCTVFAPARVAVATSFLVQAFVHTPAQEAAARALATEFDTEAERRGFTSLEILPVGPGARLTFDLNIPGMEVTDPVASLVWRGRPQAVQFDARVPPDFGADQAIGTLTVSRESVPVGHIRFKVAVTGQSAGSAEGEPTGNAKDYSYAFVSYAAGDRGKVLARVQMLHSVGIGYFQDVLGLDPGDRWERELYRAIDRCDLFLLFWSSEARQSKWVRREVAYALARKSAEPPPEIQPVIIEGPPIVKPWPELAHLHFNDRLVYLLPSDQTDP
jgi:TIR domain